MDTRANRMSGGPKVMKALYGTSLPSLAGSTIPWENNEVQTLTKSGTVSGGTFTIEVLYDDGSSETTAAIAYDANAATIKSALAALDGLDASDLTITGATGDTVPPFVFTFTGTYANTPMELMIVDGALLTGGGSYAIARTSAGRQWAELPDIVKDVKIKPIHKTEDHRPADAPMRTDTTSVDIGVDEIALIIEETDLDAFNLALSDGLLVTTAAGASQVSLQTLTQPLLADADEALYSLALVYKGPRGNTGWGQVDHYYRVKRKHSGDFKAQAGNVRTLGLVFEVMADSANSYRCHQQYEYQSAATS